MAAILGHEGEIKKSSNSVQGNLKVLRQRAVGISQCIFQYGRNTASKVEPFYSMPLCEFSLRFFRLLYFGHGGISLQLL